MVRSRRCLDRSIGADQSVIMACTFELSKIAGNGAIRGLPGRYKNRLDETQVALPGLPGGSPVEKNHGTRFLGTQERSEQIDQGLLVIQVAQGQPAKVGDQIMTVNDVLHAIIVTQEWWINHMPQSGARL